MARQYRDSSKYKAQGRSRSSKEDRNEVRLSSGGPGRSIKTRSKRTQIPRTEAQYQARPEKFKETWDRVLSVISKMRTDKISLTQASRDVGVSPRTVTRWGKSALRKQKNGKYAAKASDKLLRIVMIATPEGMREIAVRESKQVSLLAEYWNALHRYLQTGDAAQLKTFQGKHIKDANGVDVPLLTDLPVLNRLGSAGVLSFESLYARSA
jgi:hypothetical protein